MEVKDLDLLKMQTSFMKNDITVKGYTAALAEQIQKLAHEVENVLIYGRLDEVPEEVLDILAWSFNVDWYDAEADVETKRQAVKNVLILARIKGTPAAVQRVAEIYLGDAEVEEWFDYAGQPYHFRIVTNNAEANSTKAAQLIRAIDSVKNLRSKLDSVMILSTENFSLNFGFAIHTGDNITLKQVN